MKVHDQNEIQGIYSLRHKNTPAGAAEKHYKAFEHVKRKETLSILGRVSLDECTEASHVCILISLIQRMAWKKIGVFQYYPINAMESP